MSTFTGAGDQEQARANDRMWARGALARNRAYTTTNLRPPEREILARHREALSERVLELGCGAGRLTGHLARVAASLHAIDVSTAMVNSCRRRHPDVSVEQRDLRKVSSYGPDSFDAVVAPFNVLDVLGDDSRRQVLDDIRLVLSSYGYLVMSSHNLAAPPSPKIFGPARPRDAARMLHHLPRMVRNRRRLRRFERHGRDYAILNDISHDYGALHYYITRDAQERQLDEHGFVLVECLDRDGRPVPEGEDAAHSSELHYVARRTR